MIEDKVMVGSKMNGVRIEYRIKGEKGLRGGYVTHILYTEREKAAKLCESLMVNENLEWFVVDCHFRKNYERMENPMFNM